MLNSIFCPDLSAISSVLRVSALNRCWLARKSVEALSICLASGAMPADGACAAGDKVARAAMPQHRVNAADRRL